ncbi:MAG: transposase [Pseudomonadota bacterium]
MAAQLDDSQRNTVVEGEPDARPMGYGKGPKPPSYNLQTAVDADTGLILHHEVTTEPTDNRLLHPMAKATKDTLGVVSLTVVADAGYSNGAGAAACENDGITPCAPANRSVNNQGDGTLFDRSTFVYQPDTDTYACPGERVLVRKQIMRRDNCVLYAAQDCSGCAFKTRCTTAARRFLTRHLHDDALARMNARVVADPGLMRQRRCAAEHPFGTIKRMTAGDDSSPGAAKRSAAKPPSASSPTISCAPSTSSAPPLCEPASPEPTTISPKKKAPENRSLRLLTRPARPSTSRSTAR